MILETSFKEKSSLTCDTPDIMSSIACVPSDRKDTSKKFLQCKRSSSISMDYDSSVFEDSGSIFNSVKPDITGDHGRTSAGNQSACDSPSALSLTNHSYNFSKNTTTVFDDSDLFYSPKSSRAVSRRSVSDSTARTSVDIKAIENTEPDDFYIDDFDIDDLADSDIPDYFDEPASSSVSNSSTVTKTVKEGGSSKSSWERKPATPAPAPKPSNVCSPG